MAKHVIIDHAGDQSVTHTDYQIVAPALADEAAGREWLGLGASDPECETCPVIVLVRECQHDHARDIVPGDNTCWSVRDCADCRAS